MSILKFLRGKRNNIPDAKIDGQIYVCVDDGTAHFDYTDDNGKINRKQINAGDAQSLSGSTLSAELNYSDNEIPTSNAVKTYVDSVVTGSGSGSSSTSYNTETWTFTLVDGTTVSKEVLVK
jgi:hypothetical protein